MHVHSHRVRYHEVDLQGFFFNSRYFEVADVAMAEYFRQLGWDYSELNALGVDPSVVTVEARFVAPARYDDRLDVDSTCARVGTSSFDLRSRISRGDETIAELSVRYVNVDARLATSVALPEVMTTALRSQAAAQ